MSKTKLDVSQIKLNLRCKLDVFEIKLSIFQIQTGVSKIKLDTF